MYILLPPYVFGQLACKWLECGKGHSHYIEGRTLVLQCDDDTHYRLMEDLTTCEHDAEAED